MKINKVVRIALSGGLLGALFTNSRRALDNAIRDANEDGWHCHQILYHSHTNLFMMILSVVVLILTVGLWTFGAGYLILLEKEKKLTPFS